ncbi:PREDICTED: uncharacterized protein LOC104588155 [Nelumbo nucifera]|uniref:Uncharacterized protein LOC104588155 n=2 Tax=Nelumbo nucifera TaxID=4432 RepID=A0A1U7YV24_NELNU|nr:PREDICTED: uncharacterized protein LOC104588155 [Nelumbo nucifera]DAD21436.1 TPA_asm: hypothetical protein HUJ06_022899 [Nelumbo nucifera]
MASNNINTTKATDVRDAEGNLQERIIETVDYRTSPGQGGQQEQLRRENVQVVHQPHWGGDSGAGSMLSGAYAAVVNTIQSAKESISGNTNTNTTNDSK